MRILALAIGLAASSPAWALSCLWGISDANVEPDDRVPTNAVLLVEHTFDATVDVEVELRDADGNPVGFSLERGHMHALLTPDAPLAPNAVYTLASAGDAEGYLDVTFTTDAGPDTEAPEPPSLDDLSRMRDRSIWGDEKGIRVTLGESWGAAHYEYEISTDPDFANAHRYASRWTETVLGQRLCSTTFPDYDPSERYYVRARAVDLAGNASDWATSDGTVRGCATVVGNPGYAALLPFMLVLARRRLASAR
ncbi:MAG: hypothetical protein H6737_02040 [Alphaproteobacteria bacterium]|nr:hypothetical protein [Alphaproteobacteria bacterium]